MITQCKCRKEQMNSVTTIHADFRLDTQIDAVFDPLTIPEERAKVVAELERRLALENDLNTKWYSNEEIRQELGL